MNWANWTENFVNGQVALGWFCCEFHGGLEWQSQADENRLMGYGPSDGDPDYPLVVTTRYDRLALLFEIKTPTAEATGAGQ